MFFATYKNTLKNIVRTPTFWLIFVFFIIKFIDVVTNSFTGYFDMELQEMIWDTDPRYVVGKSTYIKRIISSVRTMTNEPIVFLTAASTVFVLNRDYGDNFYEIEKAAGIKAKHYLWGRLTALVTLVIPLGAVTTLAYYHTYIFSRGGVPSMDLATYFTDSAFRVLRTYLFVSVPAILFYIGFTYFLGTMFRSGIAAAVVSIGYMLFNVAVSSTRLPVVYKDYLSPTPYKVSQYFDAINRKLISISEMDGLLQQYGTDLGKAALCVCILVGLAVLYSVIAYLRTRKRDR